MNKFKRVLQYGTLLTALNFSFGCSRLIADKEGIHLNLYDSNRPDKIESDRLHRSGTSERLDITVNENESKYSVYFEDFDNSRCEYDPSAPKQNHVSYDFDRDGDLEEIVVDQDGALHYVDRVDGKLVDTGILNSNLNLDFKTKMFVYSNGEKALMTDRYHRLHYFERINGEFTDRGFISIQKHSEVYPFNLELTDFDNDGNQDIIYTLCPSMFPGYKYLIKTNFPKK